MRVKNITKKLPKSHKYHNKPVAFPNVCIYPGQVVDLKTPEDIELAEFNIVKGFIELAEGKTPTMPKYETIKEPVPDEDAELLNMHWRQTIAEIRLIRDTERLERLAGLAEEMEKSASVKEAISDRIEEIKSSMPKE